MTFTISLFSNNDTRGARGLNVKSSTSKLLKSKACSQVVRSPSGTKSCCTASLQVQTFSPVIAIPPFAPKRSEVTTPVGLLAFFLKKEFRHLFSLATANSDWPARAARNHVTPIRGHYLLAPCTLVYLNNSQQPNSVGTKKGTGGKNREKKNFRRETLSLPATYDVHLFLQPAASMPVGFLTMPC